MSDVELAILEVKLCQVTLQRAKAALEADGSNQSWMDPAIRMTKDRLAQLRTRQKPRMTGITISNQLSCTDTPRSEASVQDTDQGIAEKISEEMIRIGPYVLVR